MTNDTSLERYVWAEQNDKLKSVKNYENKEKKFCWIKNFNIHYTETSNLDDFNYVTTGRKGTAFQKGFKMPILGCFWPTLTSCIFWSSKDIEKIFEII